MKTEYYINRWLRTLDMVAMVIAPISINLPLFLMAVQSYLTAKTNGTNYTVAIVMFLVGLLGLICFGYLFGKGLKSYLYHQVTKDDVKVLRIFYSVFILGSLYVYFLVFFLSP